MLQFEAMAIGGLGAYFVFCRKEPIHAHRLFSKPLQALLVLLLAVRLFVHQSLAASSQVYASIFDHPVITPLLIMAVFAWFIINVAVNERSIIRLDSRVLNYLGGISYGIYMYHALVISLVFVPFLDDYREAPELPMTILLHVTVAAFTVIIAALSKACFEDKVLWYKVRFQAVKDEGQEINHANKCIANASGSLAA